MQARFRLVLASLLVFAVLPMGAFAQTAGFWTKLPELPAAEHNAAPLIRPASGLYWALDPAALAKTLALAPTENTPEAKKPIVVELPAPDGSFVQFELVVSSVMEPALAAAFPEIRSFAGRAVGDPAVTIRCDVSPQGFRAQVLDPGNTWYIDPASRGRNVVHVSYYRRDYATTAPTFTCHTHAGEDHDHAQATADPAADGIPPGTDPTGADLAPNFRMFARTPGPLRTFRVAVCTTGEWTAANGGTVTSGLAAVNTVINRVSGIYETDFAVRLLLVGTNNSLIFTSAATDPFDDPADPDVTITECQTTINSTIGTTNYDVGHIFHYNPTQPNGLAMLSAVCGGSKGQGYSAGAANGDFFSVDYVAHELGHQFGGRHPFANCANTGAGDNNNLAIEPGSGSTIMAYAGICGSTNLQAHSDPYFNGLNVQQVLTFVAATACRGTVASTNTAPTITFPGAAGTGMPPSTPASSYTIPSRTPYQLTAIATDAQGDAMTYCWEQINGAQSTSTTVTDTGSNPIARSFSPSTSPTRSVPRMANLLANTSTYGEILPTTTRTMLWRVTVRDNHAGSPGVEQADMGLSVSGTAGPFTVTAPATGASLTGPITVTWNVAGTDASPVNCANVRIRLSTDGGNTWPHELAASTPNTGSASVVLPSVVTSQARIRVDAVGNIFFNVNAGNFTITAPPAGVALASSAAPIVADTTGNGNGNGYVEPGESDVTIAVPVTNAGQTTATGVTGVLQSLTPTLSVVQSASTYADIATGVSVSNSAPYVIAVSPGHACGDPINLRLTVTPGNGSAVIRNFTLATGSPSGTSAPATFSFNNNLTIPDGSAAGVNGLISVSGQGPSLAGVVFRFNGSSCSSQSSSTTVGISHGAVGQLIVKLTSPAGTTVTLIDRPGSGTNGSTGNNFCQTVLEDGAANSIESIANNAAPYSNTYAPANPLSAFNGENPNGLWVCNVADVVSGTQGNLRAFSIVITTTSPTICNPPATSPGACCAVNGACALQTDAAACASGTFQGHGTACTPNPCPQPTGACCVVSVCSTLTAAECLGAGGTYQGDGAACIPSPCPEPTGACCLGANVCEISTQSDCAVASGTYQGDDSTCAPSPCPLEQGACCGVGNACSLAALADDCPPGTVFRGLNTACNAPGNLTTPCCFADFNLGGVVDIDDIFIYLNAWFAADPRTDTNANGVNIDDIFIFLNAWFAGC